MTENDITAEALIDHFEKFQQQFNELRPAERGPLGGTVGTGILRTPGPVARRLESAGLIYLVWLLAGIYALTATNVYAELASSVPRAGGPYVFVRRGLRFDFTWGATSFGRSSASSVRGSGEATLLGKGGPAPSKARRSHRSCLRYSSCSSASAHPACGHSAALASDCPVEILINANKKNPTLSPSMTTISWRI